MPNSVDTKLYSVIRPQLDVHTQSKVHDLFMPNSVGIKFYSVIRDVHTQSKVHNLFINKTYYGAHVPT